jgi:hypothetical protein
MATRATVFRREQERHSKPPKPKKVRHKRRAEPLLPDELGVGLRELKLGAHNTAVRNRTSDEKSKGGPALENSATGKPSRKSTRSSAGHVKLATNLTRRQTRRVTSSKERAARARVR